MGFRTRGQPKTGGQIGLHGDKRVGEELSEMQMFVGLVGVPE